MQTFKTTIKDYQIIKKASLEFTPGLNVIIGPSNNGKTSILKALKANMFTVPGAAPIRAGQSSYAVGIQFNEHTVVLQKSPKDAVYLVDGEKYTKFGVTTPEAVSKALNIKELVLNGNKEQLNFWDQMTYPFLLDRSAVELFRFIVDSGDNDQVSTALKSMVSDRKQLSKDIDVLQGSINVLDDRIENLKNQVEQSKPIIEAANAIIGLQTSIARLNTMKSIKATIDEITINKTTISNKYNSIINNFDKINKVYDFITTNKQRYNILTDYLIRLNSIIGDESDVNANLAALKIIPNIDLSKVTELNEKKKLKEMINYISDKKKDLESQSSDFYNIDIDDLKSKLINLKDISYNLSVCKTNQDNIIRDIDNKTAALNECNALKDLFDICPLCGNTIKHKH